MHHTATAAVTARDGIRGSGHTIYADRKLADRLEALLCAEFRRLAEIGRLVLPTSHSEYLEVGGGVAMWLGHRSPVNQAVGLGMAGPVDDADIDLLEAFYHERGAAAATSICPLADPSLLVVLGRRGWKATAFEHVLALELDSRPPGDVGSGEIAGHAARQSGDVSTPEARVCAPHEREEWAHLAALGFSEGQLTEPNYGEFGRIMAAREEAILVSGWLEEQCVGTGALVIEGGVGWLAGDSTLPGYRRRGVQQAVQRRRLELAQEAGCDLAVTEAEPGSGSQRNMERFGFRVVYTHVEFTKPAEVDTGPPRG